MSNDGTYTGRLRIASSTLTTCDNLLSIINLYQCNHGSYRIVKTGFKEITLTTVADTATLTLNRPEALNAITPLMLDEINAALDALTDRSDLRFLILTGAGRAFSAGVDLKALGDRRLKNGKVGDLLDLPARASIEKIESLPVPVIARINGFCFTGALEIALACDIIVVADKARIGDTHAKWGLRPTWGLSQRLPQRIGIAKARELSFTARTLNGQAAFDLGLANAVAPLDGLDQHISGLIAEMRGNSAESLVAYKDLYRIAENDGLVAGLRYEADTGYSFSDTDDRLAEFRS
jgi:enoyl-CoA hydratase